MLKKQLNHVALGGTDCLGRSLTSSKTLPLEKEKLVGIFYHTWHSTNWSSEHGGKVRYPEFFEETLAAYDIESLGSKEGPFRDFEWGTNFYWGKPLLGNYHSTDEWVVRKHIEMLTHAGIDFLVFDTTNTAIYKEATLLVMRILDEGRKAGWNTPKVAFYTNTDSGIRIKQLYEAIYEPKMYPDTWFCIDGKPMIIGNVEDTDPKLVSFFHFKNSVWPNAEYRENGFPWMDFGWPQTKYTTADGKESVVSVSVAQNSDESACFGHNYLYGSTGSHGRSYHDGNASITKDSYKYGYNFAQQWKGARELDPDIVLVTGWNEWSAGVWENDKPIAIYDCINAEYSRDIEPMVGGYKDAYYLQLIDEVRKFKGICKEVSNTLPFYAENFTLSKDQRLQITYTGERVDTPLRNIITAVTVEENGDYLVFGAKTSKCIDVDDRKGDWMRLFVNTKESHEFEYCFNLRASKDKKTVAAKKVDGRWERIGLIDYKVEENKIFLYIPKNMFADAKNIYFKWVDSLQHCLETEDFYLRGSCAPLGALYYGISIE